MEDSKDRVYNDDEPVDSKNINICQFERNPHLETTTRARHNPKHVDERTGIVQEMTSKISQTVHCWWIVHRWGWVRPNTGESFGRISRREVSIIVIVKDIMIKGLGFSAIWKETLILAGITIFMLVISLKSFKIRLS